MSNYAYSTPKKPDVSDFSELTERKYKSNELCGAKSANICVIAFVESSESKSKDLDPLKPAIGHFAEDPVSFAYVDVSKDLHIQGALGGSKAVLYKPKRGKYMALPSDSADALKDAVSDALGGGGSWEKAGAIVFGSEAHDEL